MDSGSHIKLRHRGHSNAFCVDSHVPLLWFGSRVESSWDEPEAPLSSAAARVGSISLFLLTSTVVSTGTFRHLLVHFIHTMLQVNLQLLKTPWKQEVKFGRQNWLKVHETRTRRKGWFMSPVLCSEREFKVQESKSQNLKSKKVGTFPVLRNILSLIFFNFVILQNGEACQRESIRQ